MKILVRFFPSESTPATVSYEDTIFISGPLQCHSDLTGLEMYTTERKATTNKKQ